MHPWSRLHEGGGVCNIQKRDCWVYHVPTESVVKERGWFAFIGGRAQARKPSEESSAGFVIGVSRNDDF